MVWRGWFYTTDHVDIALEEVNWYRVDTQDPAVEFTAKKAEEAKAPKNISAIRNQESITQTQDEIDTSLRDFYTEYDPFKATVLDEEDYNKYIGALSEEEREIVLAGSNFYEISFKNIGGMVMPIIIQFTYADDSKELVYIPAEIWRKDLERVTKIFARQKEVTSITLDPFLETADVDVSNNHYPQQQTLNRFQLYKQRSYYGNGENPMHRDQRAKEKSQKSGTN